MGDGSQLMATLDGEAENYTPSPLTGLAAVIFPVLESGQV